MEDRIHALEAEVLALKGGLLQLPSPRNRRR
jgi:hypothetical protein